MNHGVAERILSKRRLETGAVADGGMRHGIAVVGRHRLVLKTLVVGRRRLVRLDRHLGVVERCVDDGRRPQWRRVLTDASQVAKVTGNCHSLRLHTW